MAPSPPRGDGRPGGDGDAAISPQNADHGKILQQRLVREAAELPEEAGAQEQGLIAVGHLQQFCPPVGQFFHQPQPPLPAADSQPEGAGRHFRPGEFLPDQSSESGRKQGIGMEKQEQLATGCRRPGVHLFSTALSGGKHPGAMGGGDRRGAVIAAAVHHDDLYLLPPAA